MTENSIIGTSGTPSYYIDFANSCLAKFSDSSEPQKASKVGRWVDNALINTYLEADWPFSEEIWNPRSRDRY